MLESTVGVELLGFRLLPRRVLSLLLLDRSHTLGHGWRGAADRVGHIVVAQSLERHTQRLLVQTG